MALDFIVKDIIHRVTAKFIHAYLPEAKKPYNLKAVFQPELDIHGVASKASVYNIETDPKIIEDGLTAACELIYYLTADGYRVKTPLFTTRVRLPGEYEGDETHLPAGVHPEVRMSPALPYKKYIEDRVQIQIDGIEGTDGLIAEAADEKTGHVDDAATIGNLLTIHGYGIKLEADSALPPAATGLFFKPLDNSAEIRADIIAVNEPRTLKAIVPALTPGQKYYLVVRTQSSPKHSTTLLAHVRQVQSEFYLTAQA